MTKEFHLPSLSIAIVDKEKVLFSACYGEGSSPDTPYIIGSMSKSFTAAAIMQLMEKGEIDLDAPISRYLDYMSHMFLLPERGLGVVMLINTNDYLVTNSFTGQISGSVALMLMGQEPVTISSSTYKIRHILIDVIYFILLLIPAMIAFRLKKYFLKCKNEELTLKKKVGFLFLHLFLPVISLLAPRLFAATPLWVVRYFVPDLFLVLVLFSGSLLLLGITKIIIRKINLTKFSTNP